MRTNSEREIETRLVRVPSTAVLAGWPALGKCLTKSVPARRVCCTLVCRGGLGRDGDTDVSKTSDTGRGTHRNNLNWTCSTIYFIHSSPQCAHAPTYLGYVYSCGFLFTLPGTGQLATLLNLSIYSLLCPSGYVVTVHTLYVHDCTILYGIWIWRCAYIRYCIGTHPG